MVGDVETQSATPSQDTPVAGSAPTTSPEALPDTPDLKQIVARLGQMEERLKGFSHDELIQEVIRHPSMKRSQRDMIDFRMERRTKELAEAILESIDELESAGADPEKVRLARKAANQRARQMAEQELKPEAASDLPATLTQPAYDPAAEAQELFKLYGVGWADFPEWQGRTHVTIDEIRKLAPQRSAEKAFAAIESDRKAVWMKEYEREAKKTVESIGAATPPPAGGTVEDNPIKDITSPSELYRLARAKMDSGGKA